MEKENNVDQHVKEIQDRIQQFFSPDSDYSKHMMRNGEKLSDICQYLKFTKDTEHNQIMRIKETLNKHIIDYFISIQNYDPKRIRNSKGFQSTQLF